MRWCFSNLIILKDRRKLIIRLDNCFFTRGSRVGLRKIGPEIVKISRNIHPGKAQGSLHLSCSNIVQWTLSHRDWSASLSRPAIGEMGVSWYMGFVETLSFYLSANYDFTKEYHLYKGTNNTHTPYRFQACSTNTVGMNQLFLIFHLLSKFFSFQKS